MTDFSLLTIETGASSEITRENFILDYQGITNWLKMKNLITDREVLISFYDLMPWTRTGGETYCTSFEFATIKSTKQIIIKAIVTLSPEKSLQDWARRRKFLATNGIPVSNWYYHGEAVIIEDLYPNTFQNVKFENLLAIGYKLDQLGFSTLKYLDDIRSDKDGNPFFIDFGFDLGDPSTCKKSCAKEYLLRMFPHKQQDIGDLYV